MGIAKVMLLVGGVSIYDMLIEGHGIRSLAAFLESPASICNTQAQLCVLSHFLMLAGLSGLRHEPFLRGVAV